MSTNIIEDYSFLSSTGDDFGADYVFCSFILTFIMIIFAMREMNKKGGCVIVGRLADYILREHKNLIRVFIAAEEEERIAHICERDGIGTKEAQKMLRIIKERSMYYYCSTDCHL